MTDTPASNTQSLQKMVTGLQALAVSGVIGRGPQSAAYKILAIDPVLKSFTNKTALEHVFSYLNKDDGHNTLATLAESLKGRKNAALEALPQEHRDFVSRIADKINEAFGVSKDKLAGVVDGHEGLKTAANVIRAATLGKPVEVAAVTPPHEESPAKPAPAQTAQVG